MESVMNEKILEVTITSKNTHMKNELQVHDAVLTYERNTGNPFNRKTTTVYSQTTYYDNYTKIKIEAIDKENKTYSLKVSRDDFLPEIGDTIKVCINNYNEIIAYQPYTNADPVSIIKNHKFSPFDYYKWSFIIYTFPLSSPFIALQALKTEKKFVDGDLKNTYIFSITALVIIAIQIYSSYNLYKYGWSGFVHSAIGYVISGALFVGSILLHDLRETASKSLYISKLKKMLKN
jgi:hypothetical protein